MFLMDGTAFCNSNAICTYACDTNITVGSQSERIDVSSNFVNLISNGTTVMPDIIEAKTQAPYSGLDSESIAHLSPFLT